MGWTVTQVTARAGASLGLRRRWRTDPGAVRIGPEAGGAGAVFARAAARRYAELPPADRKAIDTAREEMGADRAVLDRALTTGVRVSAVAELAAIWEGLSDAQRDVIRAPVPRVRAGPVHLAGTRAVQVDQSSCGAAVMAMMLMIGDPFVALWVATGRHVDDFFPLEALIAEVRSRAHRTVEERWNALQRVLHVESTRFALGPVSWPRSLGTPPWRVNNTTRFAGLKFRGALVDDASSREVAVLAAHLEAAVSDGIPVPMYVGGDSSGGLGHVVPRHVVLVLNEVTTRMGGRDLVIYEPSSGAVHRLPVEALSIGPERWPALGHWSRVCWLVLPSQRSRP